MTDLILASTYKVASHLPTVVLDGLLSLPHFLISVRNRLLLVQPFRDPPTDLPPPVTAKQDKPATAEVKEEREVTSDVEINSDADVESNAGDTVESSWISLNKNIPEA